jgi:hypothetical protein
MYTAHEDQRTFIITSSLILPKMRNISDTSCRENQTHSFCSTTFSENRNIYEIIWKNMAKQNTPHSWQCETVHAVCMLDKYGHRRTLRISKTYGFRL